MKTSVSLLQLQKSYTCYALHRLSRQPFNDASGTNTASIRYLCELAIVNPLYHVVID